MVEQRVHHNDQSRFVLSANSICAARMKSTTVATENDLPVCVHEDVRSAIMNADDG